MISQKKTDIHKAGVFYTCYVLTKLGFAAIDTDDNDAHVIAEKDKQTIRFNVHAKTDDSASRFDKLDLKFDYLVILTHILEDPNVYIIDSKKLYELLKARGPDTKGIYWLQIEDYRKVGKYWDQL